MVGKPNQNVKPAPLKPEPAFNEPFSEVIIDCVGTMSNTNIWEQLSVDNYVCLYKVSRNHSFEENIITDQYQGFEPKFSHNLACPNKFNLTKLPVPHLVFFNK